MMTDPAERLGLLSRAIDRATRECLADIDTCCELDDMDWRGIARWHCGGLGDNEVGYVFDRVQSALLSALRERQRGGQNVPG